MKPTRFLLAAVAVIGWSAGATAQQRGPRDLQQLRCIHDRAPAAVLERIAQVFWTGPYVSPQEAGELLAPAAEECMRTYSWTAQERQQALGYAIAIAGRDHIRARMAALGLSSDAWDEVYASSPIPDRIGRAVSPSIRDRAIATISPEHRRRDPLAVQHSGLYFAMRGVAERTERGWAGVDASE